jgi:hypothetical protein
MSACCRGLSLAELVALLASVERLAQRNGIHDAETFVFQLVTAKSWLA